MVEGHPVAVQSPAKNKRGQGLWCDGRYASLPGDGENVACTSLTTVAFVSFASRTSGKNSASSLTASSMISPRGLSTNVFDELTTNST